MKIETIKEILNTRLKVAGKNETEKSLIIELLKMAEELEQRRKRERGNK